MKVAIPTNTPGGLSALRSGHFGHCEVFTIVEVSPANEIIHVSTLVNEGHEAGGCMAPVSMLQAAGVGAIVVSGLGSRPMQGFNEVGIEIYYADQEQVPDVTSVLDNLSEQKLVRMHPDQVCSGSSTCRP